MKNKLQSWELNSKIDNIINSNIKEIPYEGTEIDKSGLKEDILELLFELCPEYKQTNQMDQTKAYFGS